MTPQERKVMELALEALAVRFSEGWHEGIKIDASDIMLLNDAAQALAQPEQEPVAKYSDIVSDGGLDPRNTTPPQRTWVGLTDEEISELIRATHNTGSFVRAIEAKLKEKNF